MTWVETAYCVVDGPDGSRFTTVHRLRSDGAAVSLRFFDDGSKIVQSELFTVDALFEKYFGDRPSPVGVVTKEEFLEIVRNDCAQYKATLVIPPPRGSAH